LVNWLTPEKRNPAWYAWHHTHPARDATIGSQTKNSKYI